MRQYCEDRDPDFSGIPRKSENSGFFFEAKTSKSDYLVETVVWSFRSLPRYTVHCGINVTNAYLICLIIIFLYPLCS